jgi:hypothetical protein
VNDLKNFRMMDYKVIDTPLYLNMEMKMDETNELVNETLYIQLMGTLIDLTIIE